MDVKRLALAIISVIGVGCTAVPGHDSTEYENFKNFAMAICVGSAFSDEAVKADFNKSASGFMERGNMPLNAYEDLRNLVDRWLNKDYPSKHGGQVNSAKCFGLVGSQELAQLYDKHDPCDSEEGWLSRESFEESCH